MGIVAPLPHGESVFGVNSFYRAQGGKLAQETSAGCSQHRTPRESQAKFSGDCRRGLLVPGRGVCIWGKFVLSRNTGYMTSRVAIYLNVVLTPW